MKHDKIEIKLTNKPIARKKTSKYQNPFLSAQKFDEFNLQTRKEKIRNQDERCKTKERKISPFYGSVAPIFTEENRGPGQKNTIKGFADDLLPMLNFLDLNFKYIQDIMNLKKLSDKCTKIGKKCLTRDSSVFEPKIGKFELEDKISKENNAFGHFQNGKTKIGINRLQKPKSASLSQDEFYFNDSESKFSKHNLFIRSEIESGNELFNLSMKSNEIDFRDEMIDSMIVGHENGNNNLILLSENPQSECPL